MPFLVWEWHKPSPTKNNNFFSLKIVLTRNNKSREVARGPKDQLILYPKFLAGTVSLCGGLMRIHFIRNNYSTSLAAPGALDLYIKHWGSYRYLEVKASWNLNFKFIQVQILYSNIASQMLHLAGFSLCWQEYLFQDSPQTSSSIFLESLFYSHQYNSTEVQ